MKANRKFVQEDEAVSPVIAVILMVAITVVLAATVFVLVSDISTDTEPPPTVVLQATGDGANNRILIKHQSGETLRNSSYSISVTLGSDSNPEFKTCDDDLEAGGQFIANTETGGAGVCGVTNDYIINGGTILADANFYHVVVRHVPSQSVLLDENIEIV